MGRDWIFFTCLIFTLRASLPAQLFGAQLFPGIGPAAESCHGLEDPGPCLFFFFLNGSFILSFAWHWAHRFTILVIILSMRVDAPGLRWASELWQDTHCLQGVEANPLGRSGPLSLLSFVWNMVVPLPQLS